VLQHIQHSYALSNSKVVNKLIFEVEACIRQESTISINSVVMVVVVMLLLLLLMIMTIPSK
jgi:hypothetical protein